MAKVFNVVLVWQNFAKSGHTDDDQKKVNKRFNRT